MEKLPKTLIEKDKEFNVTVSKILDKGIIVTIDGTGYTEFIHISKLSDAYVSDINDIISVGDKLTAKGLITRNGAELTLQHLRLRPKSNPRPSDISFKQHVPKVSAPAMSIDDMISNANKTMQEKYGQRLKKTDGRRGSRRGGRGNR